MFKIVLGLTGLVTLGVICGIALHHVSRSQDYLFGNRKVGR